MRSPAREGDPAAHPSFKEARRLGPLTQLSQKVGTLLAMVLVMGALTWPPLTWGLWTLPTWAVWRPLGAFLTGWNKRMHPCIVDLFYRLFGVKMLLYGDTPAAGKPPPPPPFLPREYRAHGPIKHLPPPPASLVDMVPPNRAVQPAMLRACVGSLDPARCVRCMLTSSNAWWQNRCTSWPTTSTTMTTSQCALAQAPPPPPPRLTYPHASPAATTMAGLPRWARRGCGTVWLRVVTRWNSVWRGLVCAWYRSIGASGR
jgi:hypothetical protein